MKTWLSKWFSFSWKKLALVAVLVPVMWFFKTSEFPRVTTFIRDALQHINNPNEVEQSVVTININKVGTTFPRPYRHEETWKPLLKKLLTFKPKFIIISVSAKEYEDPEKSLQYFNNIPNLYFHEDYNSEDSYGLNKTLKQLNNFYYFSGTIDKQSSPNDMKRRRILLRYDNAKIFSEIEETLKIGLKNRPVEFFEYSFDYWGTTQIYFKQYKLGTFGAYDAKDILDGKISDNTFRNKIVIISSADEFGLLNTKSIFNLVGNTNKGDYREVFFPSGDNLANVISTLTTGKYIKIPHNFNDLLLTFFALILVIFLNIPNKTKIIIFCSLIPLSIALVAIFYALSDFFLDFSRSILLLFLLQYLGIPILMFSMFKEQEAKKLQEVNDARIDALLTVSEKVAHDIRSPLSAINLVMARATFPDQEYREIFDSAVARIDETATKILTRYRTKTGLESEASELIEVNEIISVIIKEKKALSPNIKFELTSNSKFTKALGLKLDLERIVSNIIDNSVFALKQSPQPTISINVKATDLFICIDITDNGNGIPEPVLKLLGNSRITTKAESGQGNGIGLLHAKRVIERLKGQFEIRSKENVGTTILISLPKA